jgi:nicotinate-nucleotide adenylyltransferase
MKKKVGLYFGSFNPIHIGHLAIANYLLEFSDLDEIWFIVSPQNPLKEKTSLLPDYQRLQMVNLATVNFPKFKTSDIEFRLPKPSYTIHTLTYLSEKHPSNKFCLIMGADNLENLGKWKNYNEIISNYELYVYPRPGSDGGSFRDNPNVHWANAPLMEISSSFIREAIKSKKDVRYFLPEKVYEYITEMHFYEK